MDENGNFFIYTSFAIYSKYNLWFRLSHFISCFQPQVKTLCFVQVLPKMTSHIVSDIDHILGNRPYSKKDYRS